MLQLRVPPPAVGALIALGMWSASARGPRWELAPAFLWMAVVVLVLAGLAFDGAALLAFRAARTTINPLKPERVSALVTGGVYRVSRNPMYVGMALFLTAWAVYLSALLPLAGVVVFVAYITRFQIQPEEQVLLEVFGDDYAHYAACVRRWL
jgi:protein-S-isoprenylcysteine O-methyltransferase Ste14